MHEPFLKFLREYWVVIIFFGSLVMGWSTFQSNQASLNDRVTKVEVKLDTDGASIAAINTQLAQIQTTLEFIKQQLAR